MESTTHLASLANGIEAIIFDGKTAEPQPIRLRLNLSSLSQRVSIDICDWYEGTVLSSNPIQDFFVINPVAKAKRAQGGELWLELKRAHILINNDNARHAMLDWLRQFAGPSAWQRHNNLAVVLAATAASVLLSLVYSTLAGLFSATLVETLEDGAWQFDPNRHWHLAAVEYCGSPDQIEILERFASQAGLGDTVIWQLTSDPSLKDVAQSLGGNRILVNAHAVNGLDTVDQASAALTLALLNHSARAQEFQRVDWMLQSSAATFQQLTLRPNLMAYIAGWMSASFDARAQSSLIDRAALQSLQERGLSTQGLISLLEAMNRNAKMGEDSSPMIPLPLYLSPNENLATRLSMLRASQELSAFIPDSAAPGLSQSEFLTLAAACK